jgi:hypothetical protein
MDPQEIWLQAKYEGNFRGKIKILVYFGVHTSSTTYENMAIFIIMAIENLTKQLIVALLKYSILAIYSQQKNKG